MLGVNVRKICPFVRTYNCKYCLPYSWLHYVFLDHWANDIALVKMDMNVPSGIETPQIRSVRLPQQGVNHWPTTSQQCVMKGWGCSINGMHIFFISLFLYPFIHNIRDSFHWQLGVRCWLFKVAKVKNYSPNMLFVRAKYSSSFIQKWGTIQ